MTDEARGKVYSKDYWDIVLGQVRRRPSAMIALGLLVLLYAVAIYAPLLANDRPFLFEGTDATAYKKARRELLPVTAGLLATAKGGEAAFDATLAAEEARGAALSGKERDEWLRQREQRVRTFDDELATERQALALRLDAMRKQLAPSDRGPLDELSEAADEVVALSLSDDLAGVEARAASVEALAQRARSECDVAKEGGTEGVVLVPFREFPALQSITGAELYFMALWALVLSFPLWNTLVNRVFLGGRRDRIRRARRPKLAAMALLPLLAVPLASEQAGGDGLLSSGYKAGLASGAMAATDAVFPPVAFGMAEQNLTEIFRPPTWAPSSRISEDGYYETGARSARVDEMTGMAIRGEVVDVRHAEPERNAAWRHPLGTDSLGRDILSRMIWGARVSLSVGLVSTLILVLIGTVLGSLAGFFGGWVDLVISRVIEVFQCFPVFFLILIVVAFVGQGILYIMLAIGLFRWTGVARLVRGEFIRLREQDFVVASEALGASSMRTIFRHVLPNALGPVLVSATFSVASGILTESALSFLGFGVKLPVPSWGSLLIESSSVEHWWIQVFPGLFIFLTVVLYNLFGEGVRDALDPRLKEA
ncbi:MAG: ABC transporter permease [Planctomycetes bacterium]|nr:ABC transporter permease [Planctomycetota bacterium]